MTSTEMVHLNEKENDPKEISMDTNWKNANMSERNGTAAWEQRKAKEEIISWETVKNEKLMPSPICVGRVRLPYDTNHISIAYRQS